MNIVPVSWEHCSIGRLISKKFAHQTLQLHQHSWNEIDEVQWSRILIVKMINLSLYYSILPKGSRTCTGLIVNLHWKLSRLQWKYSSPKNVVFSVAVPFWAHQGARGKICTSKDYSICFNENLCLSTHRKPPWYCGMTCSFVICLFCQFEFVENH